MSDAALLLHRDHALLYVSFKHCTRVSFCDPVTRWMEASFTAGVAARECQTVVNMERDRNLLCEMSTLGPEKFAVDTFHKLYLPAALRYVVALRSLINKTQGASLEGGIPDLNVLWGHWVGGGEYQGLDTNCLSLELCCTLFNVAAAHTLVACKSIDKCPPPSPTGGEYICESQESLSHRCKNFQAAAIMFRRLRHELAQTNNAFDDLCPEVCDMFTQVCLAQAQECVAQAYRQLHMVAGTQTTCARRFLSAAVYYQEFLALYGQCLGKGSRHVPYSWVQHCVATRALVRIAAINHVALACEVDPEKIGVRIGYCRKAKGIAKEAIERVTSLAAGSDRFAEDHPLVVALAAKRDLMRELQRKLAQDNQHVYKLRVPPPEEIDKYEITPVYDARLDDLPKFSANSDLNVLFDPTPRDNFPSILSIASCLAWLAYRRRRVELYTIHLRVVAADNAALFKTMEMRPEYVFLYFIYHRLRSELLQEPVPRVVALYQTRLGDQLLAFKRSAGYSQACNLAERIVPEIEQTCKDLIRRLEFELTETKRYCTNLDVAEKRGIAIGSEFQLWSSRRPRSRASPRPRRCTPRCETSRRTTRSRPTCSPTTNRSCSTGTPTTSRSPPRRRPRRRRDRSACSPRCSSRCSSRPRPPRAPSPARHPNPSCPRTRASRWWCRSWSPR